MPKTARFRFSSYWGTWSLVLTDRCNASPGYGPSVEIDLSPVNGWHRGDLARLRSINVRRHCTSVGSRDVLSNELPAEVRMQMEAHLGVEITEWLLDPRTEILGKIDWVKLQENKLGGGSSLYDIVHERYLAQLPMPVAAVQKAA